MQRFQALALFLVAGSVALGAQQGKGPSGARAMFYDPAAGEVLPAAAKVDKDPTTGMVRVKKVDAAKPQAAKFVGVHYWLEQEGAGPVPDTKSFKTGERVRVHIRSNTDGYLSLWSLEPSGEGKLLFPTPGADGAVKADSEYVTPGYIRFTPPAQAERLLVFFSRSRTDTPGASGGPAKSDPAKRPESVVAQARAIEGSRSLVFETDESTRGEIGTYVVNKEGGPVAREIVLKHDDK